MKRQRISSHTHRPEQVREQTLPKWLVLGFGGVLALLVVIFLMAPSSPPPPPPPPPTATPSCTSAAYWLDVITMQERAGHYEEAATTATLAAKDPRTCQEDRFDVARKAIADGLEALWQQHPSTDRPTQQKGVQIYQALQAQAQSYNIPLPLTEAQLAHRAYTSSQWLLVINILEQAYRSGQFAITDTDLLSLYISSYTNLGDYWTRDKTNAAYDDGVRMLATANAVDKAYNRGDRAAWGLLKQRCGSDERGWPEPLRTPLLKIVP